MSPPCSDGPGPGHNDDRYSADVARLQKKVDELTDMLCRVGRWSFTDGSVEIDADIKRWMAEHMQRDALRGRPWQ